jgi:UDP-2,3-diacylglucosamine pyrophosphatase LpxH
MDRSFLPANADETPPSLQVRTVWISDIHLGTPGCQAEALLEFLRSVDCETLYLVGDIIDGWQLRRSWYWPQAHNDVVQKLLRKARKGTRVVFVPGNHDEFARRYVEHNFGGVDVVEDCIHVTASGQRLWITHGDLFDGVIQCARWLAYAGDIAYEFTLKINRYLNLMRGRLGLPYWSLSKFLKLKVKRAVSYVSDFESAVAREARRRGVDGVVCGHIHHAEMRHIDGILYCNDGDWVESLTALVEWEDGRLSIIDRSQHRRQQASSASESFSAKPVSISPENLPVKPVPLSPESFSTHRVSIPSANRQAAIASGQGRSEAGL